MHLLIQAEGVDAEAGMGFIQEAEGDTAAIVIDFCKTCAAS